MKRKNIAKKMGIAVLTFGLAVSSAAPSVNAAVKSTVTAENKTEADSQKPAAGFQISRKTYQYDFKTKDGKTYKHISFQYPVAAGESEAAAKFNKFYRNLLGKWKQAAKENLAEAKDLLKNMESMQDGAMYTDEVTCKVTHSDEKNICILQEGYEYTMGAHGMPYRYTYIFDVKTGEKVSAAKLLGISKKELNTKVRNLYLDKYDKAYGTDDFPFLGSRADVKKTLNKIDFNDNHYYIKNGKMRFYVDPYAVGPYAAGFIEVAVKL